MPAEILIVGYGAIAAHVACALHADPEVRLRWVVAKPGREVATRAAVGEEVEVLTSLSELDGRPVVALECAGHAGLAAHGPAILRRGIPLGVVSTGALASPDLLEALDGAARAGGVAMELLSGAIAAIDALAAAREGGLTRVVYTGRKPPAAWAGTPAERRADLAALREPLVHYEGPARAAARLYPRNANVAATVALAGLGLDGTTVRLIADPAAQGNVHEIEATGAFGELSLRIVAAPLPDNPRTSALAAMSAVRFLRNRVRSVRV